MLYAQFIIEFVEIEDIQVLNNGEQDQDLESEIIIGFSINCENELVLQMTTKREANDIFKTFA